MGVIVINFYGGPLPLAATAGEPAPILIESSGTTQNSIAGELDITATPSGGLAPYTFSWALTETDDADNAFTISSTGTTNAATYNDAVFTANMPPSALDPPFQAIYSVACTVTDSNGDSVTVTKLASLTARKL